MMVSADVILTPGGERTKAEARRALEQQGFAVLDAQTSLVIQGDLETFERALGVQLDVNENPAPGEAVATPSKEPELPEQVRGLVQGVAFQKRAHLFGHDPASERERDG